MIQITYSRMPKGFVPIWRDLVLERMVNSKLGC